MSDWRRQLADMLVKKGVAGPAGSMNLDPMYQQHVFEATNNGEQPMTRQQWEAQYRQQSPGTIGNMVTQPYMKN